MIYIYIYIYIYVCILVFYRCVCVCLCVCICMYVCMYIYIYIHVYVYIYIYIYTCIHTHVMYTGEPRWELERRGEGGKSEKGEVLLRGVGTLRHLFPPSASVQWQPDGLTIHAKKWLLGAGFLGKPTISLRRGRLNGRVDGAFSHRRRCDLYFVLLIYPHIWLYVIVMYSHIVLVLLSLLFFLRGACKKREQRLGCDIHTHAPSPDTL